MSHDPKEVLSVASLPGQTKHPSLARPLQSHLSSPEENKKTQTCACLHYSQPLHSQSLLLLHCLPKLCGSLSSNHPEHLLVVLVLGKEVMSAFGV